MTGDNYLVYSQWYQCSDHSAVILAKTQKQWGPSQWRFLEDVLNDEPFCLKLKGTLLQKYADLEPCLAWELIKHQIMQVTQEKMKYHRSQHTAELKSLRKALHSVNRQIYSRENLEQNRIQLQKLIRQKESTIWEINSDDVVK